MTQQEILEQSKLLNCLTLSKREILQYSNNIFHKWNISYVSHLKCIYLQLKSYQNEREKHDISVNGKVIQSKTVETT